MIVKTGDAPLTGVFARQHEELLVLLGNTILNLAHPNHIREAMLSRRVGMTRKRGNLVDTAHQRCQLSASAAATKAPHQVDGATRSNGISNRIDEQRHD